MRDSYQRGFIGTEEIELAITELENLSWRKDENLCVTAEMNGKIIHAYWHKYLEELLDENEHLDTFLNLQDYKNEMLEIDEDYEYIESEEDATLVKLFKDKKIVYRSHCGNSGLAFYSGNKAFVLKKLIEEDAECSYYTYNEALENLKGDVKNVNEDLVIALLS
ncbi:MAG: hypothetical protein JKY28_05375 [Sulfurimonas sp.]|nr:hypothetical protein [Sulfurimonas sp.]PHQ90115.1 MAG: hypothetical protein COB42_05730 [Sulfurimonas sp.]